ncbi:MAG TPA: xanthine dehydrogenase family protein molybdopterin-binding subunit [Acidimicrobiales bacterium]|jgi:carbon-monoxide dehydrogenase large subunit
MANRLVGARVRRVEDPRLLTGQGRYIDDVIYPGMLHVAFLRSVHPHARIVALDSSRATALSGVVAVLTGETMTELTNAFKQVGPPALRTPSFYALAVDKVRFVGDPIAMVVAESRYLAEDGCDLIDVEYEPLDPVPSMARADAAGAPLVWEQLGDNCAYEDHWEYGDVDGAFASAFRVVRETFSQHRYANVPMEGRGAVAHYEAATGQLTYHAAHHAPHSLRLQLSRLLGQPEHRTTVLCGDVGGAFGGQKSQAQREDVALAAAARLLGRPIKWIEDRNENLMAAGQAREEDLDVEMAVSEQGDILALKVHMTMDQGAYPGMPIPISMFPILVRLLMPNAYKIDNYVFSSKVLFTNKDKYQSYRGPWAAETWARERMLDLIARELGTDRVELRLRNLHPDDHPAMMCTGIPLEGLHVRGALERARDLIGWDDFRLRQLRARDNGRYLGIGVAVFIENAPGPPEFAAKTGFDIPSERARARLEPDGFLVVFTGQAPHGQGHETTLAQVVADELGVAFESVRIVHGDTMSTPFNAIGTGGSRSATMGSGAALGATRAVKQQVKAITAKLLEADPEDIEIVDGMAGVRGVPSRALSLGDVAVAAYMRPSMLPDGMPPGIEAFYDFKTPAGGGWGQAVHACVVEVDVAVGQVHILRYLVVEDCGSMINPAIVEGQIRGGVAQGIGGVLYEHSAYGDDGQFLAGTFMDYLVPTSMEIPSIEIEHLHAAPTHEVNYRGVGEGGAIGAPPALTNAIEDALSPFGVRITEQYLPPSRILELAGIVPTDVVD